MVTATIASAGAKATLAAMQIMVELGAVNALNLGTVEAPQQLYLGGTGSSLPCSARVYKWHRCFLQPTHSNANLSPPHASGLFRNEELVKFF
jgi:hypothetical protein